MNKQTCFLIAPFLLTGLTSLAQLPPVPTVPTQLSFANISVQLDPDAQRIVQQDVNSLMANRQYWNAKLDRVVLYFPMIEAILIDEDVPTDFKYLAVQESSLTPDAVSTSSAVGYWQFKAETATGLGMRVDDQVDERRGITASTHGAARYLKQSNKQFNNWVASLYSYYLGAGGITKLIPPDWAYAREIALDGRTDRYILRFLAHKIAVEGALPSHQNGNKLALIEYGSGGGKSLRAIAIETGVDEFELQKYNRWVLNEGVPTDKPYVVVLPVTADQINEVRQRISQIAPPKTTNVAQSDVGFPVLRRVTTGLSSKNDPVLYEINDLPGIQAQNGDNASSLARKAKISVSSFMRYNDMNESDPIIENNVYYLDKKRKKALVPFHTVREGETARSISQRYGIRLKKLMRYNRLDQLQRLVTGRVMWLRERRPANRPVEIITSPTAPVYDQTPAPATRPADVATTNGVPRRVDGMDDVPRNSSERRKYSPKLVDGGVAPNDGTSEPATRPTPVPSSPAPTTNSRSADAGSERIVIVRSADAATPPRTVPVATAPERAPVTPSPAERSPAERSPARTRPARVSDPGEAVEQQADGSTTPIGSKAPPRPAAPIEVSRPTPAVPAPVTPTPVPTTPAPTPVTVNRSATTHTVETGQTYYSISRLYGLSVDELLLLNNLTASNVLEVGQKLVLKSTVGVPARPLKPAVEAGATGGKPVYHTVEKGDTMFSISKRYDVSISQIQEWNNLTDTGVQLGQRLKIVK